MINVDDAGNHIDFCQDRGPYYDVPPVTPLLPNISRWHCQYCNSEILINDNEFDELIKCQSCDAVSKIENLKK